MRAPNAPPPPPPPRRGRPAAESLRLMGLNVEEKERVVVRGVRVEESRGAGVLDWSEIGLCWRVAIIF